MGVRRYGSVLLPPGVIDERDVIGVCRVITGPQRRDGSYPQCGATFLKGQERTMEAHTAACARENHEHVIAFFETRRPRIMRTWDTELQAWIDKHHDALVEGRKRL